MANNFASLVIKRGSAKTQFYDIFKTIQNPVELDLEQLVTLTHYLKKYSSFTIGVTAGCFDVFHSGHLQSLKYSRNRCDLLIVMLPSDSSISSLKGNSRPINSLQFRKSLLLKLDFIDIIHCFNTARAAPIFDKIHFDILFKGGDYNLVKLQSRYPNVQVVLSSEGYEPISTTAIINRIKKN